MNINIYYGGRGLMDDPALLVINKMQEVLEELHVKVERFQLHELKNQITTPRTALSWLPRWNGMASADICSSFWMRAGFMGTRRR